MGDSLRRSTARSCSVALSLTVALLIFFLRTHGTDAAGAQRQSNPQQQKVYLKINIDKLSLVWNGDQGEGGRGRGEVFVSTWIFWPSKVEKENPQHKELGPLNGDVEFPSGTIVEDPPGSGQRRIQPATVLDKQFGMIYFNQADCPVSTKLLVDVLVWDEDSNNFHPTLVHACSCACEYSSLSRLLLGFLRFKRIVVFQRWARDLLDFATPVPPRRTAKRT